MKINAKGNDERNLQNEVQVGLGLIRCPKVVPVVDTSAYGSGDVLFDATEVRDAVAFNGVAATLQSLRVVDKNDQTAAQMDFYIFDASVTFGTVNAAPSISDADCLKLIGRVTVLSTDFVDLGGAKVASIKNIGLPILPATGRSIWIAATVTGTPTYVAATDLALQLGITH